MVTAAALLPTETALFHQPSAVWLAWITRPLRPISDPFASFVTIPKLPMPRTGLSSDQKTPSCTSYWNCLSSEALWHAPLVSTCDRIEVGQPPFLGLALIKCRERRRSEWPALRTLLGKQLPSNQMAVLFSRESSAPRRILGHPTLPRPTRTSA